MARMSGRGDSLDAGVKRSPEAATEGPRPESEADQTPSDSILIAPSLSARPYQSLNPADLDQFRPDRTL